MKCPNCGKDTEHDREFPPNPYICTECEINIRAEDIACSVCLDTGKNRINRYAWNPCDCDAGEQFKKPDVREQLAEFVYGIRKNMADYLFKQAGPTYEYDELESAVKESLLKEADKILEIVRRNR